jgi:hypothetical protein
MEVARRLSLAPRRGPGAARAAASGGLVGLQTLGQPLFGFRRWLALRKSALATRVAPPLVARATPFARYRPSSWRDSPRAPLLVRVYWVGPSQGKTRGGRWQGRTVCAAQGAGHRTAASKTAASMSAARGRGMATRVAAGVMYVVVDRGGRVSVLRGRVRECERSSV